GADLAKFGRLLEQPHRQTLARQRIGGGEAADAAAGNQDRCRTAIVLSHDCFPNVALVAKLKTPSRRPPRPSGRCTGNEKPTGRMTTGGLLRMKAITSSADRGSRRLCSRRCGR